jgi:hypothetical protein
VVPETSYATSGQIHIAYQVVGDGYGNPSDRSRPTSRDWSRSMAPDQRVTTTVTVNC